MDSNNHNLELQVVDSPHDDLTKRGYCPLESLEDCFPERPLVAAPGRPGMTCDLELLCQTPTNSKRKPGLRGPGSWSIDAQSAEQSAEQSPSWAPSARSTTPARVRILRLIYISISLSIHIYIYVCIYIYIYNYLL